jgi:hypothetical protein
LEHHPFCLFEKELKIKELCRLFQKPLNPGSVVFVEEPVKNWQFFDSEIFIFLEPVVLYEFK